MFFYSYAHNGNVVSIAPQSVSCEPSGGCGAVFGGGEFLPGPSPPTDFEFAVGGDIDVNEDQRRSAGRPLPRGRA